MKKKGTWEIFVPDTEWSSVPSLWESKRFTQEKLSGYSKQETEIVTS